MSLVLFSQADPLLPGTDRLEMNGDVALSMVRGIDRFLLRELETMPSVREKHWTDAKEKASSWETCLVGERRRLSEILGVRDERSRPAILEFVVTSDRSSLRGTNQYVEVHEVRWSAFKDVQGEGLLLLPTNGTLLADVVAVPDADQTPEQLVGLMPGMPVEELYPLTLAQAGCRVLIPSVIGRQIEARNDRARMTDREYIYRPAYELGRHVIGYEIQKILSGIDFFEKDHEKSLKKRPIGILGWGEGGMLALFSAALDERIDMACVSGFFGKRDDLWQEPMDRNIFGILKYFGASELALMVDPRCLIVETCKGPRFTMLPGKGGAPGRLQSPELEEVRQEWERIWILRNKLGIHSEEGNLRWIVSQDGKGPAFCQETRNAFLQGMSKAFDSVELEFLCFPLDDPGTGEMLLDLDEHIRYRRDRQLQAMDRHNQWLLAESPYVRQAFFKDLDLSSLDRFQETIEPYRDRFRDDIIGSFDLELSFINPRSRRIFDEENYVGYEVLLDVYTEIIAYGILLMPKGLRKDETRPAVVCQHGLEGRPLDLADPNVMNPSYHQFGIRLVEEGFVVFAPQNPYIHGDLFRTLQRKANPMGKTLFSVIVAQHQQIVRWLGSLPEVDPERIAFYGLSYGGKTAMRVPALVPGYCLSICSADFNDWVWKNASTRSDYSYVWTGEYEIFEFDLGSTFNYAQMAALICPRPFMVERGHFDTVAPDERVAYEFAQVRHLYQGRLGLTDRCEIEWFVGPHTIHGKGTFAFLRKHLQWPNSQAQ